MHTPALLSRSRASSTSGTADVSEWTRGRLLGVLTGAAVVAVVLLVGLGYAAYLAVAGASGREASGPGVATGASGGIGPAGGTPRRDAIAAQPMLTVPASAAQPTDPDPMSAPSLSIPAGTGLTGPALVATGFPHSPEGAIGQLAQIDVAVLQAMSPRTAREVHAAWALPGGVAAEDWWTATTVDAFLAGSGMGEAIDSEAAVTVEPAAALVKGTDGPDWAVVCVLMEVTASYRSTAQVAWGHCERMQWVGGRWMLAPGAPPAPAPATWPDTALANQVGWRSWQTDNSTHPGGEHR